VDLHERYSLTRIINAAGTFTPLGVSRSSERVRRVVDAALGDFYVIDELQRAVSDTICAQTKAEAARVTHCVAAAITLAVAATMTGDNAERVAQLPEATGLADRVVIPAGHVVNYGHSILTAIRMAGARPVVVGGENGCSVDQIDQALKQEGTACLLLVSSRLVRGEPVNLAGAVACARRHNRPAIIDGAAQDMRIDELLATGADLVLVSTHKYLASPTAGLMIGRQALVRACRAQEQGIGRAMKATKESLCGVLAALEDRAGMDAADWQEEQARKVAWFMRRTQDLNGVVRATDQPDPSGMPFSRARLALDSRQAAQSLAETLENGSPSIRVMKHGLDRGQLFFELVPLDQDELVTIVERLRDALSRYT